MPLREDVTVEMMRSALDWFAERGMIVRYAAGKRKFFHIPTWHDYQNTDREARSEYPAPPEIVASETEEHMADVEQPSAEAQTEVVSKSRVGREEVARKSRVGHALDIDIETEKETEKEKERQEAQALLVPSATAPPPPAVSDNGKKRPKRRKPPDKRLKHPAILAWSEVSGTPAHRLNLVQRGIVVKSIRGDPKTLDRWKTAVRDWLGRGWNPVNVAGQVDYFLSGKYRDGESRPKNGRKGNQHEDIARQSANWQPKSDSDREWLRQVEAARAGAEGG